MLCREKELPLHAETRKRKQITARRDKSKPQKTQLNKQLEAANTEPELQAKDGGTWKENLGKYLIDISKYVVTGVIITSIFKDLDDKIMIYICSGIAALAALIVGLILTNKKKGH